MISNFEHDHIESHDFQDPIYVHALSDKDLIHKKERRYFIFAVIASIIAYILLAVSITGIIFLLIGLALSLFVHALMLAFIRTNGVKLGPEQFPEVYGQAQTLATQMRMRTMPDIYVMQSGGVLNAFASRFFGKNMVVLYSEIFELIAHKATDEVAFILAHELAHIKRRHISKQLAILPALWIPFAGEAYSRSCEYTCDRYAAYYTSKAKAATNSLVILAIGKALYKQVNLDKFLEQINSEHGFFVWLSRKLSTHPPLPERIREVGTFMGISEVNFPPVQKSKAGLVLALSLLGIL
ncbi:MAG: M48 family metallopeptidase [Desulfitobacteriaceae bacterium]